MIDHLIPYLEQMAEYGQTWGPLLVFFFMAVESSFVPFPSEIVMIPAGFMAARKEFFPADSPMGAVAVAVACGIAGSLVGAYINYFLSAWLGRPFLHKYGRFFFLPADKLERGEELFREYGEVTTFVCRLIPVVRQLISIPAGISRMNFLRFSLFTGVGAGLWVLVLTLLGYWFGCSTKDMSYGDLVHAGKDQIKENLIWIILGSAILIGVYIWVHKKAAGKKDPKTKPPIPALERSKSCEKS